MMTESLRRLAHSIDASHDAWSVAAGNYSSRFAGAVAGTVHLAAGKIRDKARQLAGAALDAPADGLTWDNGTFVAGRDGAEPKTIADLALYAYVHCAEDAGASLAEHEAIVAWIGRVEDTDRFENDLEPLPAHALERPL